MRTVTTTPDGGRRVALVIGNAAYTHISPLRNPLNDVSKMTTALKLLGFEVTPVTNTSRQSLRQVIDKWGEQLRAGDVALFYYAGHAVEVEGVNYLCPTDANPRNIKQVAYETLPIELVLGWMEIAHTQTNIVLLDACRDNPFRSLFRTTSVDGGLSSMTAPSGTFIGFAASPGHKSSDGDGDNGLYTEAILGAIARANRTIDQIFNEVNATVRRRSGGKQVPFKNSSLEADFYFKPTDTPGPYTPPVRTEPAKPVVDLEPVAMRYITGGSFEMGSSDGKADEKPVHRATVKGFRMATYETTVGEFEKFVEASDYKTDAEKEGFSYVWNGKEWEKRNGINWRHGADGSIQSNRQHPVINVSHNDAVAYCEWLSRKTGKTYRLPTEAEWEYAAGNGSTHSKYSWGNSATEGVSGNVADETAKKTFTGRTVFSGYADGYTYTAPVGSYKANEFGLHDMTGNVSEWCSDWYGSDYYANSGTSSNPTGPTTGSGRVLRGGSWYSDPAFGRVALRSYSAPSFCYDNVGFRVVSLQ
ncbi:SUMF1/EgtB/PvdO family nonheme iron enzyme [Runella sp. MFBS21]|uniref:SUMF1/EgtB/PvdO family nonheme iron enzyme n=1 Tax=Runella sp. MFBS21 TaxID=3034018 RepID=UPI0023F8F3CB|nr:SUMF1/EgtB/PvdO family nonheme iron enzyme [Runella sp. MFBS21]MDF7821822.1 SUMF1/EgtB/PvdO family nonheme iron enzyme [Runella sp. MFBS21]